MVLGRVEKYTIVPHRLLKSHCIQQPAASWLFMSQILVLQSWGIARSALTSSADPAMDVHCAQLLSKHLPGRVTMVKCPSACNAVTEIGDHLQRPETLATMCRPQEAQPGEQPRSVRQHRAQADGPARADPPGHQRVPQRDAWRHQLPASTHTHYLCHILCHLLIGLFQDLPPRTRPAAGYLFLKDETGAP